MTFLRRFYIKACVAVIWFDVAWAESEHVAAAQHGEEGGLGWGFIFKLINFLVFFYIIFRVAKKQLPVILNKRQEEVTKALAEAKAKEEQAHTLLREYDKKLNGLGDLIQKTLNEARQQAESEKQAIIEQAKREAQEIVVAAERSAKNLEARISAELRQMLVSEALQVAERKAREEMDDVKNAKESLKKQNDLVKYFIDEVGSLEGR